MKYRSREMPIFDTPLKHLSEYDCCMLAEEWIDQMCAKNPDVMISVDMRTAIHDAAVQAIQEHEDFERRQTEGAETAAMLDDAP